MAGVGGEVFSRVTLGSEHVCGVVRSRRDILAVSKIVAPK